MVVVVLQHTIAQVPLLHVTTVDHPWMAVKYRRADNSIPVSFTVSALELVYATNFSRVQRERERERERNKQTPQPSYYLNVLVEAK
jgi:hypothetical protein